jgi:hypothetical protein
MYIRNKCQHRSRSGIYFLWPLLYCIPHPNQSLTSGLWPTHAKISHLVTSLSTSRQQVVCRTACPKLSTSKEQLVNCCNNLVDVIRLVARSFQQVWYSHDITILLQPCLVTFLLYHDCVRLVRKTLLQVWKCYKACYKLLTACSKLVDNNWEQAVRTQHT